MSKNLFGLLDAILLLAGAAAFSCLMAAQASPQPSNGTDTPEAGQHGPPPEAVAACSSVASGTACSFTGRQGQMLSGTCMAPEGKALACRPTHGREGHAGDPPHGNPPEGGPHS